MKRIFIAWKLWHYHNRKITAAWRIAGDSRKANRIMTYGY